LADGKHHAVFRRKQSRSFAPVRLATKRAWHHSNLSPLSRAPSLLVLRGRKGVVENYCALFNIFPVSISPQEPRRRPPPPCPPLVLFVCEEIDWMERERWQIESFLGQIAMAEFAYSAANYGGRM